MLTKARAYQRNRKLVCETCGRDVTAAVAAIGETAVENLHRITHDYEATRNPVLKFIG